MDKRTALQLSGDQNTDTGTPQNLQFILDLEASKLDGYLNGRINFPINPPVTFSNGTAAILSVPADSSTLTLSDGVTSIPFTFLSGGTGATQIDTASGIEATIAGVASTIVNASGLNLFTQAAGIILQIVNKKGGTAGNVAITTTSSAVQVTGMSGGTTAIPLVFTEYVISMTRGALFMRRADMPDAVKADMDKWEGWLNNFMLGLISVPGTTSTAQPVLVDSNWPAGQSDFDGIFGTPISPTSTVNTSGNVGRP